MARRASFAAANRFYSHFRSATYEAHGPALQRSFMYVPADKEVKLKKMTDPSSTAIYPDILVLNCEDGVALSNKVRSS